MTSCLKDNAECRCARIGHKPKVGILHESADFEQRTGGPRGDERCGYTGSTVSHVGLFQQYVLTFVTSDPKAGKMPPVMIAIGCTPSNVLIVNQYSSYIKTTRIVVRGLPPLRSTPMIAAV